MGYQPELGQMCDVVRDDVNPFGNNGTRFDGEKFMAHSYSWNDDEEQEFNFAWRDVRVSWYKYLGRGTTINRDMSDTEVSEMLRECMAELLSNVSSASPLTQNNPSK
jgi:hypothetical protein